MKYCEKNCEKNNPKKKMAKLSIELSCLILNRLFPFEIPLLYFVFLLQFNLTIVYHNLIYSVLTYF